MDEQKLDLEMERQIRKENGNMAFVGKSREYNAIAKCKDLRHIESSLLGKSLRWDVPGEFRAEKKLLVISEVYAHHCLCICMYNDIPLKTSLSTADLVEKGIISFATGYPEVIK